MGTIDDKSEKNTESFTENRESDFERGEHPNSLANLHKFQKGVSGNPLGRPQKFENLRQILNEFGDEKTENWKGESLGTRREQVWEKIWKKAIDGDMKFVQLLARLGCLDDKK